MPKPESPAFADSRLHPPVRMDPRAERESVVSHKVELFLKVRPAALCPGHPRSSGTDAGCCTRGWPSERRGEMHLNPAAGPLWKRNDRPSRRSRVNRIGATGFEPATFCTPFVSEPLPKSLRSSVTPVVYTMFAGLASDCRQPRFLAVERRFGGAISVCTESALSPRGQQVGTGWEVYSG